MKAAIMFVAAICAAQVTPVTDEAAQKQLTEIRARMGRTLRSLPNYVCLQTTERLRASKNTAKSRVLDFVELDVAHVGDKEMYSWPGRNMFADSQLQKALPVGLVATGAYASQVIDILFGPATQFRWVGTEPLGERSMLRWDFTVPKADSGWTVGNGKRSAQVGSVGSIWADSRTLAIARLVVHASQFPARFPLKSVTRSIDYASARIGARDVLLPSAVEDSVEEAGGALNINRSRFGHCREYLTSSTLTFSERPATPEAQEQPQALLTAAQPGAPASLGQSSAPLIALPPGVQIRLALDQHVRPEGAVIGAPVNAHVQSDVRSAGAVLVPKGTPVSGVLKEYAKVNDGFHAYSFNLTIEFNELALPRGAVPFRALLKSVDTPVKGLLWLVPADAGMMQTARYGGLDKEDALMMKLDPKPGVAVLIVRRQPSFDLFPGTLMTWITW